MKFENNYYSNKYSYQVNLSSFKFIFIITGQVQKSITDFQKLYQYHSVMK